MHKSSSCSLSFSVAALPTNCPRCIALALPHTSANVAAVGVSALDIAGTPNPLSLSSTLFSFM